MRSVRCAFMYQKTFRLLAVIIFFIRYPKISLTTIDHFVALKGRDACDIVIRKIDMNDKFYFDERPASLYNIEYTPKLIMRRTTGYAKVD